MRFAVSFATFVFAMALVVVSGAGASHARSAPEKSVPRKSALEKSVPEKTAAGKFADKSSERIEVTGGATKFFAVGRPSALKINGEGAAPKGTIVIADGKATGELEVDLSTFKTGIETRDKHMKEKYLEVEKPELRSARLSILECAPPGDFFQGESAKAEGVPFKGKLRLHGVENDASGTVSLSRQGQAIKGEATFQLKIPDFKIDLPSFAGITVAEDVKVVASLEGVRAADAAKGTAK